MSVSIERFGEFFGTLYRDKQGNPTDPFPWQTRLAKEVFDNGWPDCIDLPTASGKTAAIDIAVFVLAAQADRLTLQRTVGRRIFFTVNRRVIVDEAFDRAKTLAQTLLDAEDGILKEVADALREISGDRKAPPLDIAQLRGGIYRDRAWARNITQPIIVCTTADQLGSRLLFRGYGVSASSAPIHAALCGCDSLVLLDEAHVTRAFSQTMQLLTRYQAQHNTAPKMHFVQMTATPAGEVKDRFGLDDADRLHPILQRRQEASKPAELFPTGRKSIVDEIVKRAVELTGAAPKAIGIIVNRVQTARDIHAKLTEEYGEDVHLVIGRMRPIDRDDLQGKLRELVGPDRPDVFPADAKSVFIVATQCLEVGADYDFDALLTECASIDALRQRFGRLNRKGRKHSDGTPIKVTAAIVTDDTSLKNEDPIYGHALQNTWDWLQSKKDASNRIDFGIAKFRPLWEEVERERATYLEEKSPKLLLSLTQNAAVLLPAHLDALCQTNPQPVPSPEVSYFIHGPQRNNAEVNVCWRADLGDDEILWPEIVRLLPPTSIECMNMPLRDFRRWMVGTTSKDDRDADVPVQSEPDDQSLGTTTEPTSRHVLVWRGANEVEIVDSPYRLRPNDTVVMPTKYRNWYDLGHIPEPKLSDYQQRQGESHEDYAKRCLQLDHSVDIAERATRGARLRIILRIHPAFEGANSLRGLSEPDLRKALIVQKVIPQTWDKQPLARIERHQYPGTHDDNSDVSADEVVIFKRLLDPTGKLLLPTDDDDDGDDNLSQRDGFTSLEDHTQHVVERLAISLGTLHLNGIESTVCASAPHHDIGKSDVRFQAMLARITPYEAIMLPNLLAKGDGIRRTQAEQNAIFKRAMYPRGFRHEMLSVELIEHLKLEINLPYRDLFLHLIAAHHGNARPFAPVCLDNTVDDELRSVCINNHDIGGSIRKAWISSHRLDSGVPERFWALTRKHGWWGLAWLESILRLADQQASAAEQDHSPNQNEEP